MLIIIPGISLNQRSLSWGSTVVATQLNTTKILHHTVTFFFTQDNVLNLRFGGAPEGLVRVGEGR